MIPRGVLFLMDKFWRAGTPSLQLTVSKWVRTPPTSKPHHGSEPLRPPTTAFDSTPTVGESFVALPGSPYLGYTGAPFGGAPAGFGTTGIGPLGFALMILTTPGMQSLLSGWNNQPDPAWDVA